MSRSLALAMVAQLILGALACEKKDTAANEESAPSEAVEEQSTDAGSKRAEEATPCADKVKALEAHLVGHCEREVANIAGNLDLHVLDEDFTATPWGVTLHITPNWIGKDPKPHARWPKHYKSVLDDAVQLAARSDHNRAAAPSTPLHAVLHVARTTPMARVVQVQTDLVRLGFGSATFLFYVDAPTLTPLRDAGFDELLAAVQNEDAPWEFAERSGKAARAAATVCPSFESFFNSAGYLPPGLERCQDNTRILVESYRTCDCPEELDTMIALLDVTRVSNRPTAHRTFSLQAEGSEPLLVDPAQTFEEFWVELQKSGTALTLLSTASPYVDWTPKAAGVRIPPVEVAEPPERPALDASER